MKCLILAGGFATRLWPLTEHRAKPLLLLDGKTILAHLLDKIPEGMETILLTNKKFEQNFRQELFRLGRSEVGIFCEDAFGDGEKLGALKAISVAITEYDMDESIMILAGDNMLPELNIEQLNCSDDSACIAVQRVEDAFEARKFGVVEVEGDRVIGFEEKPENPKSLLVSTGCTSIGKNVLDQIHVLAETSPDRLGEIFAHLLAQKVSVKATEVSGEWFDVGSFETYLAAHKAFQKEALQTGKNTELQSNTFSGKVFVGADSQIKNCQITDSIIYPNVKLENCHLSQVVIDEGCDLKGLDLCHKLVRGRTQLSG